MKYHDILFIDDDEDEREIFLTAIKRISISVTCNAHSDAAEALRKLTVPW